MLTSLNFNNEIDKKNNVNNVNNEIKKEEKKYDVQLIVRNVYTHIICDSFIMMELQQVFSYVEEDFEKTRDRKVEWWLKQNNPKKAKEAAEWDGVHSLIENGKIGTGLLEDLIMFLMHRKYVYEITDKRGYNPLSSVTFQKKQEIILMERQEEAMESIRKNDYRGVINASVSFGKTHLGLYIAMELSRVTVIIATKKEIISQWKDRIEEIFLVNTYKLGTANAYSFANNFGDDIILLCTPRLISMAIDKNNKLYHTDRYVRIRNIIDKTATVIYDEVHHASSSSSIDALSSLDSPYRIGLSGTVNMRSDNSDYKYLSLIGNVIHTFSVSELIGRNQGKKVVVKPIVMRYDRVFLSQVRVQSEDWNDFYTNFIVENRDRNNIIISLIMDELDKGSHILVLVDRIAHANLLVAGFSPDIVITTNSKESVKIREEKFKRFRNGNIRCLICTFSIAGEGFDVPSLNTLIFAGGKSEIKIRQAIGRIMRKSDTDIATLYDFADPITPFMSHFLKRLEVYMSETAFEIDTTGLPFWITQRL